MKKHILLVENDREELRFFVNTLNELKVDYKCTWAQSASQALEQLQFLQPDIVLVNAQLSGDTSAEIFAGARRANDPPKRPVVLFNGYDDAVVRVKAAVFG